MDLIFRLFNRVAKASLGRSGMGRGIKQLAVADSRLPWTMKLRSQHDILL
jgi:hypothetical protein